MIKFMVLFLLSMLIVTYATHSDITRECATDGNFTLLNGTTIKCSLKES